MVVKHRT